jgi:uncharacterized protein YjbI with pentapeptide repeats
MDNNSNKQSKSDRSVALLAFFIGTIISAIVCFWVLPKLSEFTFEITQTFIYAVILLGAIGLFSIIHREWFLKNIFGLGIADLESLKNEAKGLLKNIKEKDTKNAEKNIESLSKSAFSWYLWTTYKNLVVRVFNSIFIVFGGLLGSVLLFNQNKLLQQQNQKIDQQTYLIEAQRRSTLIFEMGNILDQIQVETSKTDKTGNRIDTLTKGTVGRVSALSWGLKPYRFYENGEISKQDLSPERGQLLIALTKQEIDTSAMKSMLVSSNFKNSDLRGVNLGGAFLRGIVLFDSDFRWAILNNADFEGSLLNRVNFEKAYLVNSNLMRTTLDYTSFKNANLSGAYLWGASMDHTDFSNAILDSAIVSIDNINKLNIVGKEEISKKYKIEKKGTYFIITKK